MSTSGWRGSRSSLTRTRSTREAAMAAIGARGGPGGQVFGGRRGAVHGDARLDCVSVDLLHPPAVAVVAPPEQPCVGRLLGNGKEHEHGCHPRAGANLLQRGINRCSELAGAAARILMTVNVIRRRVCVCVDHQDIIVAKVRGPHDCLVGRRGRGWWQLAPGDSDRRSAASTPPPADRRLRP